MRITVNLSYFFDDHRYISRIFVNDRMKHIKDIEDRIAAIFKINNFYLKCENYYLPSSEDVHILNYDDIVWAIPNNEQKSVVENAIESGSLSKMKEKKKKKEKLTNLDQSSNKKRKYECEEENVLYSNETKSEKKRKCKNKPDKSFAFNIVDSVKESSDNNKNEDIDGHEKSNVKVKSLESKEPNFKTNFGYMKSVNEDRKFNIVKTIIISNKPSNINLEKVESELEDTTKGTEQSCEENEDLRTDEDKNGTESFNTDSVLNGHDNMKRRRKRVRKRKHTKKDNSLHDSLEYSVQDAFPKLTLISTSIPQHIKFEDEKNNLAEANGDEKADQDISEKLPNNIQENYDDYKITEEFILKQPISKNIKPRENDIIAFKILRISEDYTPGISSSIVGRVKSYNSKNGETLFDIIYGEDQCKPPSGKFFLDSEDVVEPKSDTTYQCMWDTILEPRLLYP